MTEKTLALYSCVMRRILELVEAECPGNRFAVEVMISDYEEAILVAMQTAFSTGRSRECWFHYPQVEQ